jgi:hypothetical protein
MTQTLKMLRDDASHCRNRPLRKNAMAREKFVESRYAPQVFATYHPSAILRLRDAAERETAFRSLVRDLALLRPTAPARRVPRPGRARSSAPRSGRRRPSPSGRRAG